MKEKKYYRTVYKANRKFHKVVENAKLELRKAYDIAIKERNNGN